MSVKVTLQQALKSQEEAARTLLGVFCQEISLWTEQRPLLSGDLDRESQHLSEPKGAEIEGLSAFSLPQALLFRVNRAKGNWHRRHCSQGKMTAGGGNGMREAER